MQETHSSSIFYLDPGKCDCKANCSFMVCFFTPNNSFWHTLISGLLGAMFDMLFVLPVLPLFPGILLSPSEGSLHREVTRKLPLRITVILFHMVSVTKQQQQVYSTSWRTKWVLRMPTTQAVVLSLTKAQSCCTWTHQVLGYFNIRAVDSSRQGTGMNQVQGPSSESRQEMRPKVGLETRAQQGPSTGQDIIVQVGVAAWVWA